MTTLTITREVASSATQVWDALCDYEGISAWNPNLKDSYLLEGSCTSGEGALRQCDMKDGKNWIRERVVAWRHGESYTVDIYEGTMPLRSARATLGVKPLGNGTSEAFMRLEYTPKFGPLGVVMNAVMMRSMMKKNMAAVLEGLASHLQGHAMAA